MIGRERVFKDKVILYRHESLFVKIVCEVLVEDHYGCGVCDLTLAIIKWDLRLELEGHADVLQRIIRNINALVEAKIRIVEEIGRRPLHGGVVDVGQINTAICNEFFRQCLVQPEELTLFINDRFELRVA